MEKNGLQTDAQLLKGVTSIYLYRGRKRLNFLRGYGLYATNNTLLGVKVRDTYGLMLLVSPVIQIFAVLGFITILVGLVRDQPQPSAFPISFALSNVLLVLSIVASYAPRLLVEKRFKTFSQPRLDWIAQGKDFETGRDRMLSIEFRWPGDLRIGHILLATQSGSIKIWLMQPASRSGLVLELRELLARFCYQNPRIELVEKA